MDVSYPNFHVHLTPLSASLLQFEIKGGPFARTEIVVIEVVPLGNGVFVMSWREKGGAAVTNVQDYDRGLVFSFATLPDGQFLRMTGTMVVRQPARPDLDDRPRRNKAPILDAMTSLFQRHDASAVERLYARDCIQHNPNIPQGRDALQAIVAGLPDHAFCEPGLVVAIHSRIRGWADEPQIVDIFRIEDGRLAEHWDVLQNEVPVTAHGGISMFEPAEEGHRNGPEQA